MRDVDVADIGSAGIGSMAPMAKKNAVQKLPELKSAEKQTYIHVM